MIAVVCTQERFEEVIAHIKGAHKACTWRLERLNTTHHLHAMLLDEGEDIEVEMDVVQNALILSHIELAKQLRVEYATFAEAREEFLRICAN
jgi:hypothetical protein